MSQKPVYQALWALTLLAGASLACGLLSQADRQLNGIQKTAGSVETSVESGRNIVATGQSVATQVLGNQMVQTAVAYATQQAPALIGTAQAFATNQGPSLIGTVETFATQQGPGLISTAQAFITQQGPGALETLQALATQQGPGLIATGEALATQAGVQAPGGTPAPNHVPDDIPVPKSGISNLTVTPAAIVYVTSQDIYTVKKYFEQGMRAAGWVKNEANSHISNTAGVQVYSKGNRTATITLSYNLPVKQTIVAITIQAR